MWWCRGRRNKLSALWRAHCAVCGSKQEISLGQLECVSTSPLQASHRQPSSLSPGACSGCCGLSLALHFHHHLIIVSHFDF